MREKGIAVGTADDRQKANKLPYRGEVIRHPIIPRRAVLSSMNCDVAALGKWVRMIRIGPAVKAPDRCPGQGRPLLRLVSMCCHNTPYLLCVPAIYITLDDTSLTVEITNTLNAELCNLTSAILPSRFEFDPSIPYCKLALYQSSGIHYS